MTWGLEAILVPLSQLSGAGIRVAVLDTGFDHTHPDFLGRSVTKKLFASRSSPDDVHGHGTHGIGTACGPLRPAGVAQFDGERLDVVTEGDYIDQGSPVVVVRSEGYRHIVRPGNPPLAASDS